jgi:hypothetical protein
MHNAHELSRAPGLGCSPFARRYSGNRFCFLFLGVLRWFTSPRSLRTPYFIQGWIARVSLAGLPHSEIFGSKPACGSPKLIAAYRVLHRPRAPRHPPYALSSLTIKWSCLAQRLCDFTGSIVKELRIRGRILHRDIACRDEASGQASMENTGLEPVTSWLQTRRSAS